MMPPTAARRPALMQIGPRRRPDEPLSKYRIRGAAYCAVIALALAIAAFGLYVFRPYLGHSQFALAAIFVVLLAVAIGIPTMVFLAFGYLVGALWARREERNAPQRPSPERVLEAVKSPAFELAIDGSSFLWVGVLLAFLGIAFIGLASAEEPVLSALAVLLIAMAGMTIIGAAPALGKPKLELSYLGFRTPHTPFISWSEVQGVHLRASNYKGHMNHALMFRVETLPQRIGEFSAFHRMIHFLRRGPGKETFFVPLRNTSYPPEMIYMFARVLWTQATGRDHVWNPDMPERYNAAQRNPDDPANQMVIGEELRRKTRQLLLLGAVGIAVLAAYVALRIFG